MLQNRPFLPNVAARTVQTWWPWSISFPNLGDNHRLAVSLTPESLSITVHLSSACSPCFPQKSASPGPRSLATTRDTMEKQHSPSPLAGIYKIGREDVFQMLRLPILISTYSTWGGAETPFLVKVIHIPQASQSLWNEQLIRSTHRLTPLYNTHFKRRFPQVLSFLLRCLHHSKEHICVDCPFMCFVQDDDTVLMHERVPDGFSEQHPICQELDFRLIRSEVLKAHCVANLQKAGIRNAEWPKKLFLSPFF